MTALLSADDYAGRTRVADPAVPQATGFRRRAVGVTAVLGGLAVAAGFATTVWETGPEKLAYLDSLVVDPLRSQVAAVLLFAGYLGLAPVLLAFTAMTRRRGRVLGNVALALSWVGVLSLPGLLVTDFYDLAIRQELPADAAVRVSDAAQQLPLAALIGGPSVMAVFLGLVLAAVAGWRAGFFHWAFALLVVAAVVPMFLADLRFSAAVNIATGALLGLFMVAAGVAALRMTDRAWATGSRL